MLLIMATKTEVENREVDKPLENQDIIAVCKNLQFTDDDLKFQPSRKRCVSTSIIISSSPKKKKKEGLSMIPPKTFLLGGSISDPLNLNSLQNEDINKAMNKTPKTSPLHSNTVNIKIDQVNVLIPRDLSDPLELAVCDQVKAIACSDDLDSLKKNTSLKCKPKKLLSKSLSDSGLLTENTRENDYVLKGNENKMEDNDINMSPPKKKLKIESFGNRVCNPVNYNIPCTIVEVIEQIKEVLDNVESVNQIDKCDILIQKTPVEVIVKKIVEPCKTKSLSPEKIVKDCKKSQEENKNVKSPKCLVSPVVSLPPSSEKPCNLPQVVTTSAKPKQKVNKNVPKFKDKNALFKYGNYNRYYGYRNPDDEDDRLKVLAERMDLFYGKDVLDVGCNIGHVTFSVARDFGAKSVVGMDIDRKLINIARKNVQYYINDRAEFSHLPPNYQFHEHNLHRYNDPNWDITQSFPMSLPMMYGPIDLPGMTITGRFPFNVSFVQGNYVLESDALLSMETCKFDVILCLSITKWIHLNWGDDGLKRTFKRMYAQLRPGGILVVEPQPWKSYGRRKTLTETIWYNYKNIEFKPPMFTEYLINEVGFVNCETLAIPHNPSKGFQRPLKLYRKPSLSITRNTPNCTIVQPNETQQL